ncbi:hypothetical protein EVAR_68339_1 [Eumeta japonica]|uniref:Uncharacterized protein n=1 Tax=Eumeta variegata TaxID=151549 RepID=A0A4C2A8G8_EUMVA|nr:hypothetical protein EVAR_68339_1 [Eumeta japonica]
MEQSAARRGRPRPSSASLTSRLRRLLWTRCSLFWIVNEIRRGDRTLGRSFRKGRLASGYQSVQWSGATRRRPVTYGSEIRVDSQLAVTSHGWSRRGARLGRRVSDSARHGADCRRAARGGGRRGLDGGGSCAAQCLRVRPSFTCPRRNRRLCCHRCDATLH